MKPSRFAIALTSLSLFAATLVAADNQANTPSTEPFTVTAEREPINTIEPLYRAYLAVGTEKFSFFIPEKFRLGGDPQHGRLTVSSVEADVTITMVFMDRVAGGRELSREYCRELIADQYPNSKIVEEFSRPMVGHTGQAFDVEWKTAAGLPQKSRIAFVPSVAGTVELSASGGLQKFKTSVRAFNDVANSLVASVNGKLQVVHLLNVN